ncbi:MAG: hypothetical protein MJ240_05730, partial [Kiritimatiellae bacterium]|nr:hypothetical protein [Kiritimatiellia bacterium]
MTTVVTPGVSNSDGEDLNLEHANTAFAAVPQHTLITLGNATPAIARARMRARTRACAHARHGRARRGRTTSSRL